MSVLIYSLVHPVHSFIRSFKVLCSHIHLYIHSFTSLFTFTHSLIHLYVLFFTFIDLIIQKVTRFFIVSPIYSFIFINTFIHSSVHTSTHSFVRSLVRFLVCSLIISFSKVATPSLAHILPYPVDHSRVRLRLRTFAQSVICSYISLVPKPHSLIQFYFLQSWFLNVSITDCACLRLYIPWLYSLSYLIHMFTINHSIPSLLIHSPAHTYIHSFVLSHFHAFMYFFMVHRLFPWLPVSLLFRSYIHLLNRFTHSSHLWHIDGHFSHGAGFNLSHGQLKVRGRDLHSVHQVIVRDAWSGGEHSSQCMEPCKEKKKNENETHTHTNTVLKLN